MLGENIKNTISRDFINNVITDLNKYSDDSDVHQIISISINEMTNIELLNCHYKYADFDLELENKHTGEKLSLNAVITSANGDYSIDIAPNIDDDEIYDTVASVFDYLMDYFDWDNNSAIIYYATE